MERVYLTPQVLTHTSGSGCFTRLGVSEELCSQHAGVEQPHAPSPRSWGRERSRVAPSGGVRVGSRPASPGTEVGAGRGSSDSGVVQVMAVQTLMSDRAVKPLPPRAPAVSSSRCMCGQ